MTKNYNALDTLTPTIPAHWYYDPAQYQTELREIWGRHWLYVCKAETLDEPGAFRTMKIGDQNVVIIRTSDGALAAYHNACRHRGSVLFTEPSGVARGKTITCPYHQWCYAADDGRLVATTSFQEPEGFDKSDFGLFPVALKIWRSLVFINLDKDAAWSDDAFIEDGAALLKNFPIEDLVVGATWSKRINCNWKTYWDNYNECLHCPETHPALTALVPIYKRGLLDEKDRPDWRDHASNPDPKYRGGVVDGAETWSTDGSAQGVSMNGLSEEDIARRVTYADLPPSTYVAIHMDHGRVVRFLPRGPEEIELSIDWLFTKDALADPSYDKTRFTDFLIKVQEEDGVVCELNQQGMHAAPFEQGVLMPEEYGLKSMHDWIRAQLAIVPAPPAR